MVNGERDIGAHGKSVEGLDLGIARNPSTGGEGPVPSAKIVTSSKPEVAQGTIEPDVLEEARVKIGPKGNFSRNSA
jgi:hypothetical protein